MRVKKVRSILLHVHCRIPPAPILLAVRDRLAWLQLGRCTKAVSGERQSSTPPRLQPRRSSHAAAQRA